MNIRIPTTPVDPNDLECTVLLQIRLAAGAERTDAASQIFDLLMEEADDENMPAVEIIYGTEIEQTAVLQFLASMRKRASSFSFLIDEEHPERVAGAAVTIDRRLPNGWAVSFMGNVLTKDGGMEREPLPSSRDADFIERTRWPSVIECWPLAIAWRDKIRAALDQGHGLRVVAP